MKEIVCPTIPANTQRCDNVVATFTTLAQRWHKRNNVAVTLTQHGVFAGMWCNTPLFITEINHVEFELS